MKENPKSGSASAIKNTKWVYFESMDFLRDLLEPAPLQGNLTCEEISYTSGICTESGNDPSDSSSALEVSASSSNITDKICYEENANMKRKSTWCSGRVSKKKNTSVENAFLQLEKEKLQLLKADSDLKNDPDYNFLISCFPHFKSMSEMNKLRFRMETTKLLMDIKQSEMNVSRNSSVISSRSVTPTLSVSWESCGQNNQPTTVLSTDNTDITGNQESQCEFINFHHF